MAFQSFVPQSLRRALTVRITAGFALCLTASALGTTGCVEQESRPLINFAEGGQWLLGKYDQSSCWDTLRYGDDAKLNKTENLGGRGAGYWEEKKADPSSGFHFVAGYDDKVLLDVTFPPSFFAAHQFARQDVEAPDGRQHWIAVWGASECSECPGGEFNEQVAGCSLAAQGDAQVPE